VPLTVGNARRTLDAGLCTARSLLAQCLEQIDEPEGEGVRAFITVHRERAHGDAERIDAARVRGERLGALAGIPISIKDLFDEAGQTTTAGSLVLRGTPCALRDAPVVASLRRAGATVIGRTNMTEFAYSGVGLNPHFGTPLAPYDRRTGRIPGGSTSGGAVSVADGMCLAAIGSDTGGSIRIPAAFCGVVGFKPTHGRLSTVGAFPLAPSFDSVGVIAHTVDDCRVVDAAICGATPLRTARPIRNLAIGVASGLPFDDLELCVGTSMERIIGMLNTAGAKVADVRGVDWAAPGRLLAGGQITAVESLACHGALFKRRSEYDHRVVARMEPGVEARAVDYARALQSIFALRRAMSEQVRSFDALLLPTVACAPPPIAELADDPGYFRVNARVLRNTTIANVLGFCAISVPVLGSSEPPVGLMLMAPAAHDSALLNIAEAIEGLIGRRGV
jgi:aspartyl-tRNA(Asn)/glutamyl-tRNA(Gln) amidotransferase subunit A